MFQEAGSDKYLIELKEDYETRALTAIQLLKPGIREHFLSLYRLLTKRTF
jgi:hypothetical protein